MRQSLLGRLTGIIVITTIVFVTSGLVWLVRYIIEAPKRKERENLLAEGRKVSADGKKMCVYCKKFTGDEINKGDIFCIECGRQRGTSE